MKLTPSEQIIHHYLTTHDIQQMTAKSVASILFVSRSSVYRVCQKMGYTSFSHFRFAQKIHSEKQEIIEVNSLDVFDHVDDHLLKDFIQSIHHASTIYVIGIFATEVAASYFVRQLLNLGYHAILIHDSFELESRLLHMTPSDLLINLSNTGSVSTMHQTLFERCLAPLYAITKAKSKLDLLAKKAIVFDFDFSPEDSPFVRENLYAMITIIQKILINISQN